MRKSRKQEVIDKMIYAFSEYVSPEKAIELRTLCCVARVSETEALMAINYLINAGMKIRLADGLPHKLYREETIFYLDE